MTLQGCGLCLQPTQPCRHVRIDYATLTIDSILHTIYDLMDLFEEIVSVSL